MSLNMFEGPPSTNKFYGIVTGIVVDNKHPEGEYRVKVKFPWIREADAQYTGGTPDDEDFFSTWCRVVQFMGGKERGSFFLPEPDDEVVIAFEHGDVRFPMVIGALWNGKDTPFYDNNAQDGKNCYSTIRTRSGHCIQWIDKADDKTERIVLQTKIGKDECTTDHKSRDGHFICLDHTDGEEKIEIYDREQKRYILLDATNEKITIECTGDIEIHATKNIVMKADENFTIEAGSDGTVKTGSNYKMEAGGTADQESSSAHTIKGSKIDLNP